MREKLNASNLSTTLFIDVVLLSNDKHTGYILSVIIVNQEHEQQSNWMLTTHRNEHMTI
jgi:hypothetical protein